MSAAHKVEDDGADLGRGTAAAQRLDKWLWFARVVKSRTLAQGLVTGGKVRVNRQRVDKPGATIRPGDVVTVAAGRQVRVLKVLAAGERRGPASEARILFEDLTPQIAPNPARTPAASRPPGSGRPTKRDRRATDRLHGEE